MKIISLSNSLIFILLQINVINFYPIHCDTHDAIVCPCSSQYDHSNDRGNISDYVLCYIGTKLKFPNYLNGIRVTKISDISNSSSCTVIFIMKRHPHKVSRSIPICPGICLPKPTIDFFLEWFYKPPSRDIGLLTCSTNLNIISNFTQLNNTSDYLMENHHHKLNHLILELLFWRRLQECSERKINHLPNHMSNKLIVSSLIIYVGSTSQKSQSLLHLQQSVIQNYFHSSYSPHPIKTIIWNALDDLYSCLNPNIIRCNSLNSHEKYMPSTNLRALDSERFGWGCAQRRPLRALAHVLLLYDIEYIFIGDDDTYINYPLYHQIIHSNNLSPITKYDLLNDPVVFGSIDYPGQISSQGFFQGGAGYILTPGLINTLLAKHVSTPPLHEEIDKYSYHLSLYKLLLRTIYLTNSSSSSSSSSSSNTFTSISSNKNNIRESPPPPSQRTSFLPDHQSLPMESYLPESLPLRGKEVFLPSRPTLRPPSCHLQCILDPSQSLHLSPSSMTNNNRPYIPINIRLIDLCVLLLSGESTCHHSDHALTRCFLHGAHAIAIRLPCQPYDSSSRSKTTSSSQLEASGPHMCDKRFTPCDQRLHVTCHRYAPLSLNDTTPVLLPY